MHNPPRRLRGKKGYRMGLLYERTCSHCKHLSEAVSCGVCEVTSHKVVKVEDNDFAEQCDLYENKYYDVESMTVEELQIRQKLVDEILNWIESETFTVGRTVSRPGTEMIIEHLKNLKDMR